jgi:hypothetical protein
MTAAVRRLQVSGHELKEMAASPMAEATGAAGWCPHAPGGERPGMFAGSGSGGRSGRRLADPVWVAAGGSLAVVVTHSSTAPGIYR